MNPAEPSLSALRAFEAAARHQSMTRAAAELNVTAGAVSLQVRELEAALGLSLFERRPRQLILTPTGKDYAATLHTAFRLIREATAVARAQARSDIVTLSCTPGFALQWLLPRVDRFQTGHAGIDLRISTTSRLVDFQRDGVALAVRHGLGGYPGLVSEKLIDDDLIVVASPAVAERLGPDPQPGALHGATLIHDGGREDWRLWLEAAGVAEIGWRKGPLIAPDSNGALEAARAGIGFALMRQGFVADDLAQGRLAAPFGKPVKSRFAYYIVYPPGVLDRPAVRQTRDWLLSEAGRS
ncbi:transcriptional regulator GcvA [Rhizobiaceae bacterium BDR2-2]|uniref:Transcriptional regulator GcvA n=1 Tax=Ectorhizobium quercum TaxID=2965071 RepID=A0AAE3MWL0_9HYPH|nr:transcriptional regulator GcvA [Ectorhizobium quercum]MCX8995751.1 transcriptional regulator GcvA [Ectorhizobium quercum]